MEETKAVPTRLDVKSEESGAGKAAAIAGGTAAALGGLVLGAGAGTAAAIAGGSAPALGGQVLVAADASAANTTEAGETKQEPIAPVIEETEAKISSEATEAK